MKRHHLISALVLAAALLVIPVSSRHITLKDAVETPRDSSVVCVIALDGQPSGSRKIEVNRAMLRQYAKTMNYDALISVVKKGENPLDSLRDGKADIVVRYFADSLDSTGLAQSRVFHDSTVWVIQDGNLDRLKEINGWIMTMSENEMFTKMRRSILQGITISDTRISPYDSLVKIYAPKMGWDWRLLSSLIYHESRFNPEARSSRDAAGLMQVRTDKISIDSLMDPIINLEFGAQYVARLQEMYSKTAADSLETIKFVLAAFNAGESRINDCITYASKHGVDPGYWDNIVELIPEIPNFKGNQTIAYVTVVLQTWSDYRELFPD